MNKKTFVGVVAVFIIILSAVYIGNSVKSYGWLQSQTAASINSQLKNTEKGNQNTLPGVQELYSIVKHLNTEIGKTVSIPATVEIAAPKSTDQKQGSSGKVLQQEVVSNTKSNEAVKGATTGPIDQEKLNRQLIQRKNFLTMLAKADARLFLLSELPENTKTKIPTSLRKELESDTTVTGIIEVIYFDDFENHENSHAKYFLRVGSERLSLYITEDLFVSSGGTFRVTGKRIGNSIVADVKGLTEIGGQQDGPGGELDGPNNARPPESVGDQKTLVLLIRFQDSPVPPVTKEEAHELVFNDNIQAFYKEQSYGKVSFSGKVNGWYTLSRNCNNQLLSYLTPGNELESLVIGNQIDLRGYNRLLLVHQFTHDGTCLGGGGVGTVGKTQIMIGDREYQLSVAWVGISTQILSGGGIPTSNLNFFDSVTIHEIGHNLGVVHGNGFDCGSKSLNNYCEHIEYGNPFDIMGWAAYALHFNAFYKERLGWISPQNSLLITKSGRYTINPLETQIAKQKNFAKIQRLNSASMPFYLEFRKGIGFDQPLNQVHLQSNQSGLLVNLISPNPFPVHPFSRLLDMRATSLDWLEDLQRATLNVGQKLHDPSRGITVGPVIESNDSSITFDVTIVEPACVPDDPMIGGVYDPTFIVGTRENLPILVGNEDSESCGSSNFSVTQSGIPESWQPSITPSVGISLDPGSQGEININFNIPANAQPGFYPITYTAVNETTGRTFTKRINALLLGGYPQVQTIQPGHGPIGTNVTLSGLNLSSTTRVMFSEVSSGAYLIMENFQLNGTNISFDVPSQLYTFPSSFIPTPPGIYSVQVGSFVGNQGVYSNPAYFEVTRW